MSRDVSQVALFFVSKSQVLPFFGVRWPPNLIISDVGKGISGPDSDSKLAPNIIDKYSRPLETARSAISLSKRKLWASNVRGEAA